LVQYGALVDLTTLHLSQFVQNRTLDLFCVIPDGLALSIQTQSTLTLLGGTHSVVADEVRVHGLPATGIPGQFNSFLQAETNISSCKRYPTTNCHLLSTNPKPELKPSVGVSRHLSHIFWLPANYLSNMTSFVRTPSTDALVELLIKELQKTGTRCETVHNFNHTYPDAKRTSN